MNSPALLSLTDVSRPRGSSEVGAERVGGDRVRLLQRPAGGAADRRAVAVLGDPQLHVVGVAVDAGALRIVVVVLVSCPAVSDAGTELV
ncbi:MULTISPECIES: hypothetical protein [unclassified Kitasatospora]|uniref:hypothetical protein n=1 Tax=unclassified Kitasatospora TaxID=2633591 RepID=UPI0033FB9569